MRCRHQWRRVCAVASIVAASCVVMPTGSGASSSNATEPMPNLVGFSRAQAWAALQRDHLFFSTRGPGANTPAWQRVVGEIPAAGTIIGVRSTVILYVTTTPVHRVVQPVVRHPAVTLVRVPNLRGQSIHYAAWLEHRAGLVVQTKLVRNRGQGFTYILGQSIRANTLVRKGWHLLLTYESLPYQVKGQHRVPAPAHHVVTTPRAQHVRVGMATWYDYVPGRCATWYLPYGKRLYIKDLQTGKIISCVNTDREAAHGNRVVDLSQTQFSQLAPLTKGVIPVRVWW